MFEDNIIEIEDKDGGFKVIIKQTQVVSVEKIEKAVVFHIKNNKKVCMEFSHNKERDRIFKIVKFLNRKEK